MKIKANYRAVKRNFKRFSRSPFFRASMRVARDLDSLPIQDKQIFFESYTGNNFSGNVYYLFKEIMERPEFKDYKKIIGVQKKKRHEVAHFLREQGYSSTEYDLVTIHSKDYTDALLTSKYLFNNSTLPTYFIKRPGQILVNTWHGTPLKTLGKRMIGAKHEIGNTQRNFLMSDYITFPNRFTWEHMREDYMLDPFYNGAYLMAGYPRNGIFHNEQARNEIRQKYGLDGKEVIAYMPTWRGYIDARDNARQIEELTGYLHRLDQSLNENKLLYVNLHNFVKGQIDLRQFKHIRPFPKNEETYAFLNAADALVTDYSSVFFDFANSGRKIVLFAYDKKEYLANRGLYFPMEDLPFPIVQTPEELMDELDDLTVRKPYTAFQETFCAEDTKESAANLVNAVFFPEKSGTERIEGKSLQNGKKNVLLFGGALNKNGLTTSLKGLVNHVDLDEYNYILSFYRNNGARNQNVLAELPEGLNYMPIQGRKDLTLKEAFAQYFFYRFNWQAPWIRSALKNAYDREVRRIMPGVPVDYAIHFTGYEKHMIHLFEAMPEAKKIIYVHNDMRKELSERANFHVPSVFEAYREFDNIVGVREGIEDELQELIPELDKDKIHIVHNVNNIDRILSQSEKPLVFDEDTQSTHTVEEIEALLADDNVFKFVDIGRFSPEKRLLRLIKAFEEFQKEHPDSALFVIGGLGVEYGKIMEYVQSHNLDRVVVIKSISNPFPIVKQCDWFVLSSHYEGLPMSIMEALILDVPVISTDIAGPRKFLSQGYGHLVEESREGVLQGMRDAYDGKIHLKKFEPQAFNEQALEEFHNLLK